MKIHFFDEASTDCVDRCCLVQSARKIEIRQISEKHASHNDGLINEFGVIELAIKCRFERNLDAGSENTRESVLSR
jgi:hypothetical protein